MGKYPSDAQDEREKGPMVAKLQPAATHRLKALPTKGFAKKSR